MSLFVSVVEGRSGVAVLPKKVLCDFYALIFFTSTKKFKKGRKDISSISGFSVCDLDSNNAQFLHNCA
jgi:hypothetical protein